MKGNFFMWEIDWLDFIKKDIRVQKSCLRISLNKGCDVTF